MNSKEFCFSLMTMNRKLLFAPAIAVAFFAITFSGCTDKPEDTAPCTETTWYQDNDGDGKGNANVSMTACEQPEGYVANNEDFVDATVENKAVPILFKITGETCYYCGDWGWGAWANLSSKFKDGKGLSWGNYGSGFSNGFFRNQEINPTMEDLENEFEEGGSKPNFGANGKDYDLSYANAEKAANDFIATTPAISAILDASIDGDQLTINAEAKLFSDMTGNYVMGAYLIEDKAIGPQSGPAGANGNPEHHLVMRGSLSSSAWGEPIITTSGTAGTVIQKTYTATLPANYKKENLSYGIIIWKVIGTKHLFVNAYSTQ